MDMPPQVLLPGVQHQRKAGCAAQPARVGGERVKRIRHGAEQQLVERARIAPRQPVDRVRQGKHQMEVRHRQQLPPPRREPGLFGARPALRAVPVAAGMVQVAQRAAVIAALDMSAERRGAAGDNSPPRLVLNDRQSVRVEIGPAVVAQNIGQAHTVGHDGVSAGRG